jgi:prepilin-type N-terminal cleavage/methylation domain-containing protein
MKNKKGFTLIELLVVIAVIAILASIVFVNLGGARQSAQNTKVISAMGQIRSVAEMIYIEDGNYENICSGSVLGPDSNLQVLNGVISANADIDECYVTPTTYADYCVQVTLVGGDTWCVSSAGDSVRNKVCSGATCEDPT